MHFSSALTYTLFIMKKLLFTLLIALTAFFAVSCAYSADDVSASDSPYEEIQNDDSDRDDVAKSPETPDIESVFTFIESENGLMITGKTEPCPELIIPAEINGKPVIEVGDRAFSENTEITSLIVSEGVKKIGKEAFKGCVSLKYADIPKSVCDMGYAAFNGCKSMEKITIPFTGAKEKTKKEVLSYPFGYIFGEEKYPGGDETVQYYYYDSLSQVKSSAYYIPSALKEVKVTGKGETLLPYDAFRSSENLKKIVLGSDIKNLGEFVFSCCSAEIVWENPEIETIGEYAYSDYKGSSLYIPESVKEIGRCAFADCEYLKEITVPDTVEKIDLFAFRGCFRMNKATIGKGVKKLGVNTFYFCTSLKEVVLSDNLEEIADSAFMSCRALSKINIPKSVKFIGKDAFKNCTAMKNIVFDKINGWRYYNSFSSGDYLTERIASDSAAVAYYLTDRYSDYIWENVNASPISEYK